MKTFGDVDHCNRSVRRPGVTSMPLPNSRDLTDTQWENLDELIPETAATRRWTGTTMEGSTCVLNGILWVLRTGAPWADVPERTCLRGVPIIVDGNFRKEDCTRDSCRLHAGWDAMAPNGGAVTFCQMLVLRAATDLFQLTSRSVAQPSASPAKIARRIQPAGGRINP